LEAKVILLLALASGAAAGVSRTSLASNGWTVSADPETGRVRIAHAKLGTLAEDAYLGTPGVTPAGWTIYANGSEMVLRSAHPPTAWRLHLLPLQLIVSSTSAQAVLTASVPAPPSRVAARLLDPEGVPVTWTGTGEVANSYGGTPTSAPSRLPRRNPECMYFTLGQAEPGNLHGLFDRPTDTAVDFGETARFERRDPDRLSLTLPVEGNTAIRLTPDYYTKTLGLPFYSSFDDSHFTHAPMVWSSWTSYYAAVREQDIVRNADWLAANLKPYGFEYVQLDDGYDRGPNGEHYWIENWDKDKFPHGPAWLAQYIRGKGLHAGLWLVPNAYAGAVKEHPDWYLRDRTGAYVLDYHTPALDSTNPGVLAFLRHLFETLDGWGFDYYKFDGEHALPKYAPAVDRDQLYNQAEDPVAAYRERLRTIRQVLGPDRFVEGCPAGTPLNGIGFMDSYFNGQDLYNNWQGMYPLFSSIAANGFLNHLAVYVMPGEGLELGLPMTVEQARGKRPPEVVEIERKREDPLTGFGLTDAEARTLVSWVALTGVAYPLASVMPELPVERVRLLQVTMPTLPILPADLFSRGTADVGWDTFKHTTADYFIRNFPEVLDVKVNAAAGMYDVIGMTNWRGRQTTRTLDFAAKLGLHPGQLYAVFDFWNQKLLGVFQDRLTVPIDPHDTRVLLIHPVAGRPQLVGLSRHISGAFSVRSLSWTGNTLRGTSDTVPGAPYTLWLYLPDPWRLKVGHVADLPWRPLVSGNSLAITFDGRSAPVNWQLEFTK
jgi:hypothetical protein